jgi:sodium-dependent phosphate cotransporter
MVAEGDAERETRGVGVVVWRFSLGLLAVVGFLFAVQLLGAATADLSHLIEPVLDRHVAGILPALGAGWLGAYVALNGSVIAAIGVSLFDAGLLSVTQLFLLIIGSRLGSAAIVVLIGAADFAQRHEYSLRQATSLGFLVFLVTHTIYLPAAVLGLLALEVLGVGTVAIDSFPEMQGRGLAFFRPVTIAITARIGAPAALLVALVGVIASLRLLDRLFAGLEQERLRQRLLRVLSRRWMSFGLGVVVTGVTTSVAFSLGVVVPLYNRGFVERDEVIPYVLGASLGTLSDTLVVALALESTTSVAVVLLVLALAGVVTTVAVATYGRYARLVTAVHDWILRDRRRFVAVVVTLVLVPLVLVFVPR